MEQITATKTGVAGSGKRDGFTWRTDLFTDRNIPGSIISVPVAKETVPLDKVLRGGLFVP